MYMPAVSLAFIIWQSFCKIYVCTIWNTFNHWWRNNPQYSLTDFVFFGHYIVFSSSEISSAGRHITTGFEVLLLFSILSSQPQDCSNSQSWRLCSLSMPVCRSGQSSLPPTVNLNDFVLLLPAVGTKLGLVQ